MDLSSAIAAAGSGVQADVTTNYAAVLAVILPITFLLWGVGKVLRGFRR